MVGNVYKRLDQDQGQGVLIRSYIFKKYTNFIKVNDFKIQIIFYHEF